MFPQKLKACLSSCSEIHIVFVYFHINRDVHIIRSHFFPTACPVLRPGMTPGGRTFHIAFLKETEVDLTSAGTVRASFANAEGGRGRKGRVGRVRSKYFFGKSWWESFARCWIGCNQVRVDVGETQQQWKLDRCNQNIESTLCYLLRVRTLVRWADRTTVRTLEAPFLDLGCRRSEPRSFMMLTVLSSKNLSRQMKPNAS